MPDSAAPGNPPGSVPGVEALELAVGPWTFDAVAAGPVDGDPVLLLHGFPQTSRAWRSQLDALGDAGYRAVAPDQRGYSSRARPAQVEAYALEHLVADVVGMADTLGFSSFHLVGHDWGGAVAWHVAGRHPDRVRTLTVVSTPHPRAMGRSITGGEQREKSAYVLMFREEGSEDRFLADDAQLLRTMYLVSGMPAAEAEAYVPLFRDRERLAGGLNWYRAASVDDAAALGPITMPTLYVWSTEDVALGREAAEWTAEHVDGPYRFEVFEGVSHWVSEEAGEDLNRVLLEHLGAVGSN